MFFKMNKHKFRYLVVSEAIHLSVKEMLDMVRDEPEHEPDNVEIANAITMKVMEIVTAEMEQ